MAWLFQRTRSVWNVGVFLWTNFFCFISKHLKMGPSNGISRATLALSRVGSDANYTVVPPLEGNFFFKLCPFPPQLEKCHQAGKTSLHITCKASLNYQQSCLLQEGVPSSLFLPCLKTISSLIRRCVWKGCVGLASVSFVSLWLPLSWLMPGLKNHSGWRSVGALPLGLGRAK